MYNVPGRVTNPVPSSSSTSSSTSSTVTFTSTGCTPRINKLQLDHNSNQLHKTPTLCPSSGTQQRPQHTPSYPPSGQCQPPKPSFNQQTNGPSAMTVLTSPKLLNLLTGHSPTQTTLSSPNLLKLLAEPVVQQNPQQPNNQPNQKSAPDTLSNQHQPQHQPPSNQQKHESGCLESIKKKNQKRPQHTIENILSNKHPPPTRPSSDQHPSGSSQSSSRIQKAIPSLVCNPAQVNAKPNQQSVSIDNSKDKGQKTPTKDSKPTPEVSHSKNNSPQNSEHSKSKITPPSDSHQNPPQSVCESSPVSSALVDTLNEGSRFLRALLAADRPTPSTASNPSPIVSTSSTSTPTKGKTTPTDSSEAATTSTESQTHPAYKRASRSVYTKSQRVYLEREYNEFPNASKQRMMEIALVLQLSENQVRTWFQNRRSKSKREDLLKNI